MISNKYRLIEDINVLVPVYDNSATTHIENKKRLDWDDNFNNIEEIKQLKKNDVVIDVGAWIGDTTRTFLNQKCIVHAFEPRQDLFICLLHNCPDANCYNIALGDGRTYGTLEYGGNTGAYSLKDGQTYSIKLDSLSITKLNFLKIDVEGWEKFVLQGAKKTIKKFKPIIHIEINPKALSRFNTKPDEILKYLTELGYTDFREVYRYYDENWDIIAK